MLITCSEQGIVSMPASSADAVHADTLILHYDAIALQHPKVLLFPNVYPHDSSAPGSDLAQAPPPAPALTEEGTQIHNPDPICWTLRWILGG